MRIFDIDNQEGHELSAKAEAFIKSEYPENDFPDMYDMYGDMCLDESDFEEVELLLAQKSFIG